MAKYETNSLCRCMTVARGDSGAPRSGALA
jgi:hypothetical protein